MEIFRLTTIHPTPYRWVQSVTAFLGLWLMSSPVTFGSQSRALWVSDLASGALTLGLALVALGKHRGWASWAQAFVGLWLLFAPLVFWASQPVVYVNDTLVGSLLIGYGLLIPMGMRMQGAALPPGWSYNPSTWPQRAPGIFLAAVSFLASRYMAANLASGLWLLGAAWFLPGEELTARISGAIAGALLVLLCFPSSPARDQYGGLDIHWSPRQLLGK